MMLMRVEIIHVYSYSEKGDDRDARNSLRRKKLLEAVNS